jgi:ADP-ribose pyrophosphatase
VIAEGMQLVEYNKFREEHPELFINPPETAFEIVFDPELQHTVGAGLIYKDAYIVFLRDAVRFRDGSVGGYVRFIPSAGQGGAAVLPVIGDKIVLIQHERHATRGKHWEIPRGFADRGESPEETARREVEEEIDVLQPGVLDIGSVHPDTGASSVLTRLYLARLAGVGRVETGEGIERTRMVSLDEFDRMLCAEQVTDSFTLAAVLQARTRGLIV